MRTLPQIPFSLPALRGVPEEYAERVAVVAVADAAAVMAAPSIFVNASGSWNASIVSSSAPPCVRNASSSIDFDFTFDVSSGKVPRSCFYFCDAATNCNAASEYMLAEDGTTEWHYTDPPPTGGSCSPDGSGDIAVTGVAFFQANFFRGGADCNAAMLFSIPFYGAGDAGVFDGLFYAFTGDRSAWGDLVSVPSGYTESSGTLNFCGIDLDTVTAIYSPVESGYTGSNSATISVSASL